MAYVIERTPEFEQWLSEQTSKAHAQVEDRLQKIAQHGHFGSYGTGWKKLDESLAELKWKSGTRVYFAIRTEPEKTVIVLFGGNKNGQDKDIKRARKILGAITS